MNKSCPAAIGRGVLIYHVAHAADQFEATRINWQAHPDAIDLAQDVLVLSSAPIRLPLLSTAS